MCSDQYDMHFGKFSTYFICVVSSRHSNSFSCVCIVNSGGQNIRKNYSRCVLRWKQGTPQYNTFGPLLVVARVGDALMTVGEGIIHLKGWKRRNSGISEPVKPKMFFWGTANVGLGCSEWESFAEHWHK